MNLPTPAIWMPVLYEMDSAHLCIGMVNQGIFSVDSSKIKWAFQIFNLESDMSNKENFKNKSTPEIKFSSPTNTPKMIRLPPPTLIWNMLALMTNSCMDPGGSLCSIRAREILSQSLSSFTDLKSSLSYKSARSIKAPIHWLRFKALATGRKRKWHFFGMVSNLVTQVPKRVKDL